MDVDKWSAGGMSVMVVMVFVGVALGLHLVLKVVERERG